MLGENVVARTKNFISHTHTQDDCYTLAANAYARVTSYSYFVFLIMYFFNFAL